MAVKKAGIPAPLGEGALGVELDLELTGEVLAGELAVLTDVAGAHLADLVVLEEDAEALAVDAHVVADDGEVLPADVTQCLDEDVRDAAESESTDGEGHAVLDVLRDEFADVVPSLVDSHQSHPRTFGAISRSATLRTLPETVIG